jgi:lysophospholipase L1-like esterase
LLKRLLWFSLLILSLIGIIALSAGFHQALTVTGNTAQAARTEIASPEAAPLPAAPARKTRDSLSLVLLGDSLARGAGDEAGKGFAFYLPEELKQQMPKKVVVHNTGIDGLQTNGLMELLGSGKLATVLGDADLVLISIGGNDLRRIRRLKDAVKDEAFKEIFTPYLTGLRSIVTAVRKDAPNALIIFIGLYNPVESQSNGEDDRLLLTWNDGPQELLAGEKKAIFIPTYDLFRFNGAKYVARDALHPNGAGYQAIAQRISTSIAGYFNGGAEAEAEKGK